MADREDRSSGADPTPVVCEKFEGLNTSTLRVGVPDDQAYWLDGFMPLDARNLRTLWGIATAPVYSADPDTTVVWFGFYNIGSQSYMVVFQSDGRVVQVNMTTLVVTEILPAGTIAFPSTEIQAITQWGQQYLIIVDQQPNGYWLWDGALLYTAGTLAPFIELTATGSAYQTPPNVVFSGGTGSGATAVATIANGIVTNITVTNPGSGYSAGDVVTVTLSGGNSAGSGATFTANMVNTGSGSGATFSVTFAVIPGSSPTLFTITGVAVTSGGSGYSQFTTMNLSGGAPLYGHYPVISPVISGGIITAVNCGPPYPGDLFNVFFSPISPIVNVTDNGAFVLDSVTVNTAGSGYSPSTTMSITGGAVITNASAAPVLSGGAFTSVTVLNGGLYSAATPPTITAVDVAVDATATVQLMPFGVGGNAVETYQQHVWVANGALLQWSAPGSFQDFATSSGGGSEKSSDSFLKIGYTALIANNGVLYLVGDSSVSYISGVQTSGTPPTTTFTKASADAETGSPYAKSVQAFNRNIMFANDFGIHVCSGADVRKVSSPLDGVYDSAQFGGQKLCSSKATIFNRKTWMTLVPIVDPITEVNSNKFVMWNGEKRWWTSLQELDAVFIASQEINSVFTTYVTDGDDIFQCFQQPSAMFLKTVASKFWDYPGGYMMTKTSGRFWAVVNYNGETVASVTTILSPLLRITISSLNAASSDAQDDSFFTIPGPAVPRKGYFITPPYAVSQVGEFIGMTLSTYCNDLQLVSMVLDPQPHDLRG